MYPAAGPIAAVLDRVEDGRVAVVDAAQHPLVRLLGGVAVKHPAGGDLADVPAGFLRLGDDGRRDLCQPPARPQDQQVPGPV